jgi:hypothetical protein
MPNPTQFTWTDPTTNTDGSPIVAGEITGYMIGIRSTTAAGSVAGTYPITAIVAGATAANELISALGTVLKADSYAAAIQTMGPVNSAFTAEIIFSIAALTPNPPANFSVS